MQGHTPDEQPAGIVVTVFRYLAYLFVWFLLSALGGVLAWFLRTNLFDVGIWAGWNPWAVRGIDRWGIFVLGLLWVIYIFGVEGYLRAAVAQRRLWTNTRKVLIPVLILLAISYGLQFPTSILPFLRQLWPASS